MKTLEKTNQSITLSKRATELLTDMFTHKGAGFATLFTDTDARAKKTGNPYGQIRKIMRSQVLIGVDYGNAVRNQTVREGGCADIVEVKPRKWGERLRKGDIIPGTNLTLENDIPLVHHKGKFYLECMFPYNAFNAVQKPTYYYITDNGERIILSKEDVAPYLPAKSRSSTQDHLEREVVLRDYALESIRRISFGGRTYEFTG